MPFKNFSLLKYFIVVTVFAVVAFFAWHGYSHDEDLVDNEKLELDTNLNIKTNSSVQSSTTTIPILVYHKVGKTNPLLPLNKQKLGKFNVADNIFESQMKFLLENNYTPLTIQDLIQKEKDKTLPNKPVAVTFDDGWRSQYENALPVLVKYKIPATFFIYTGVVGSPAYMNWNHLSDLVNLKMEIGDHTKSHQRLSKLSEEKLNEEIYISKKVLEKHLHLNITDFAYPYGNYNDVVIEEVKKAGYISARTSNNGIYNDFRDLYQLNVLYAPSDLEAFKKMLK